MTKNTLIKFIRLNSLFFCISCAANAEQHNILPITHAAALTTELPEPVSNNAVAQVKVNNHWYLLSFSGLGQMKGYQDVHNHSYVYDVSKNKWQKKSAVPIQEPINGLTGRLASVATAIKEVAYVFGGYTVAKDHSEVSVPDVYAYHVLEDKYQALAPMPVPVDDSIALPYKDRYIYLISGWHNDGNVNLVQLYDTKTNQWQQASPFPGKAVFGHAGGIVDNNVLVCDGVGIDVHLKKRRSYAAQTACYRGEINPQNPAIISWYKVDHPTGESRYRMAATGLVNVTTNSKEIVFIGGSNNPYNYNGIGYNGEPSTASNEIWRYGLDSHKWTITYSKNATMDHRGLLQLDGQLVTLGGMGENQTVLKEINHY
ncbi:galactose oxidase [Colwellia sp. Arc7-635]|uniref:Kelch repeat-containing protein n=1 Tax=Colwellia sp. Arc7-635 TaxID=2497879 RepID=UPI001F496FDC|nr:galactose oxidase [Colwellia sp. Arc7-635]